MNDIEWARQFIHQAQSEWNQGNDQAVRHALRHAEERLDKHLSDRKNDPIVYLRLLTKVLVEFAKFSPFFSASLIQEAKDLLSKD